MNALKRSKGTADVLGNPVVFILTGSQVNDCTRALPLMENKTMDALLAGKGYDSDKISVELIKSHIKPVIPGRSNREQFIKYDKFLYKARFSIESFFVKI